MLPIKESIETKLVSSVRLVPTLQFPNDCNSFASGIKFYNLSH